VYYEIVIFGLYYIPHICISFIILSLLISYIENSSKNQKIKLIIGIIISLLAGMGGLRQVFITSIPFIFMSILWLFKNEETWNIRDWKDGIKSCIKFNFIMGISAFIGLVINTLYLSKIYKFQNQGNIKLSNFTFSNLENVINGFIEIFGFKNNTLISLSGIESLCALLLVCILLGLIAFYSKKVIGLSSLNILVDYTVIANVLIIALYLFSNMYYISRYLIPTAVFLIPTACLIIENINMKKIARDSILFLLSISLIGVSMNTISINNNEDKTYKLRDVEKFLEQKKLKFGYAGFWNANVITELSNGKIEMYSLKSTSNSEDYIELKPSRWLVNEKTLENKNSKNFFILVPMEDKNKLSDQVPYFSNTKRIQYIDKNYCVYVFGDK